MQLNMIIYHIIIINHIIALLGINILISEHLLLLFSHPTTQSVTNTSTTDTLHSVTSPLLQAWPIDLTIIKVGGLLPRGDVWTELETGVTITDMVVVMVEVVVVVVEVGEVVEGRPTWAQLVI